MRELERIMIDEMGAKYWKKGKSWKGYNVYIPFYSQTVYIGLPLVVLEKNGKYRISTDKEALEYIEEF